MVRVCVVCVWRLRVRVCVVCVCVWRVCVCAFSYTHLTLPTRLRVEAYVWAGILYSTQFREDLQRQWLDSIHMTITESTTYHEQND